MKPTAESVTTSLSLHDKTAIVTGASSGVGLELARVLALRGATVILACRNVDKGRSAIERAALPDEARPRCLVRACDLAVRASVDRFADELATEGRAIDRVALNAGVFGLPYRLTGDGLEYTYASNYAGHFVLLHRLLTDGRLTAQARVLGTLSENVRLNPFIRADLPMLVDPAAHAQRFGSYASPNAKALLLLALQRCARRVAGTALAGVSFNACDPGATLTDNVNQLGKVGSALAKLFAPLLMQPVEQGAAVLAWALSEPSLDGKTGQYWKPSLQAAKIPKRFADEATAEAAWRASEARLGLAPWPSDSSKEL